MRRISFGSSQAPFAAAGKVRPDPFPVRTGALCVELNGSVGILRLVHGGQLVHAVVGCQHLERPLKTSGVSVSVVEQLGSVRAHRAVDGGFFG